MRNSGLIRCVRSGFSLAAVCLAVLGLNGCGPKVEMKELPKAVDEKINTSDETKIKEYMDKAGLKGQPMAISDQGDHWLVEFQPEAVQVPGRRAFPVGPESYKIDKQTGKVDSNVGGGQAPGSGN
jgi:hypothetical protein